MRVVMYNPITDTLSEESVNTIKDYYKLLECYTFDIVSLNEDLDVYVDDEGLFVLDEQGFTFLKGRAEPLAGILVFTGGADKNGNTMPCTHSIDEIRNLIRYTRIKTPA